MREQLCRGAPGLFTSISCSWHRSPRILHSLQNQIEPVQFAANRKNDPPSSTETDSYKYRVKRRVCTICQLYSLRLRRQSVWICFVCWKTKHQPPSPLEWQSLHLLKFVGQIHKTKFTISFQYGKGSLNSMLTKGRTNSKLETHMTGRVWFDVVLGVACVRLE